MSIKELMFGAGKRKRAPSNRLPSRNFDRWRTDRFGVQTPLVDAKEGVEMGNGANAANIHATALGSFSYAKGPRSTSGGSYSEASDESATAWGYQAIAGKPLTTSVGATCYIYGLRGTGVGQDVSIGEGINNTVVGQGSSVTGATKNVTLVGRGLTAAVDGVVIFGDAASAESENSVVIGQGASAGSKSTGHLAIGQAATSEGRGSIAIGQGASAEFTFGAAIAIGRDAEATNGNAIAIGTLTTASGLLSTTIGGFASGDYAISLGQSANAPHDNAIAVGRRATTTAANQIIIGSPDYYIGDSRLVMGENAQRYNVSQVTELTTIAAAATTDTTIAIPEGGVALGVTTRVTVAPPGTSSMDVGVSGDTTRFTTSTSTDVNSTSPGTEDGASRGYASATVVRFTPNANPSGSSGRVRTTIHYYTLTPPTS